jgi:hypothetical protein
VRAVSRETVSSAAGARCMVLPSYAIWNILCIMELTKRQNKQK